MCSAPSGKQYDPYGNVSAPVGNDPSQDSMFAKYHNITNARSPIPPVAALPPSEPTLTDLVNKYAKAYDPATLTMAGGHDADFMAGTKAPGTFATTPAPVVSSLPARPAPPATTPMSNPNLQPLGGAIGNAKNNPKG